MGLDAVVYCDCFETGKLKEIPLFFDEIFVTADGSLDCKSEDMETILEFDQWCLDRACNHENGVKIHHYIGNIALVSLLHREISREENKFDLILNKILYSGTHAGDYLEIKVVRQIQRELLHLSELVCSDKRSQDFVNYFCQQLNELVNESLKVNKPISF